MFDAVSLRRRRVALGLAAGITALALVETFTAFIAPGRAPTDKDWRAAAAEVRAGFRPGDLIVAAPGWADPILRQHLGDLIPIPVAGRLDAARFGRIWEITQRGARAPEAAGATPAHSSRHGQLTLRRYDRRPAVVAFDFVDQWRRATVSSVDSQGSVLWCSAMADRHECPMPRPEVIKPELLEIDTAPRYTLSTQPVGGATLVIEYDQVPMGRELAVGAGLHNVWLRKAGHGKVKLRVLIAGQEVGKVEASSLGGWDVRRFDTAGIAGQMATVRFEITCDDPAARYFGFAAEARG